MHIREELGLRFRWACCSFALTRQWISSLLHAVVLCGGCLLHCEQEPGLLPHQPPSSQCQSRRQQQRGQCSSSGCSRAQSKGGHQMAGGGPHLVMACSSLRTSGLRQGGLLQTISRSLTPGTGS